jgi:hypothetical protein
MRGLRICLWITGLYCSSLIFGVFWPVSGLESFVKLFGIGPLPDSPLFFYLARLISATYVGVGIFYIILALRPMDYGIMVPFSGLAAVALGIVCGITGFVVKMPNLWFFIDFLSCLVLGILILVFWRRARQSS